MSRDEHNDWTPAQLEKLEQLYALNGDNYLSSSRLAHAMNVAFPGLKLTTSAVIGKCHRLLLHHKYPRHRTNAKHIGNHNRAVNGGRITGFAAHRVENKIASPTPPRPVAVKPHTVDPARATSMEAAMEAGTCLWPVNDMQVCGCNRDKSGSLARPSSYCPTHRKVGRQEPRKSPQSDVYVSTRARMSALRYR